MVRVAAVQAEAVPGDVEANLAAAARWVRAAADRGAELVVFPEAFTTGYDLDILAGDLPAADLRWAAPVQAAVDATGVTAVVNSAMQDRDRRTLSSVVLRPGVEPSAPYAKQNLHGEEAQLFAPGEGPASIEVGGVVVAISVCADADAPAHAAEAAARGADVYLNSGAWFPGAERRRDEQHATRASDNGLYVVFAGLLGAPHDFIGGSAVFDPTGRILDQVAPGVEGLAVAEVHRRG
jgi:predicted amidohydrolase